MNASLPSIERAVDRPMSRHRNIRRGRNPSRRAQMSVAISSLAALTDEPITAFPASKASGAKTGLFVALGGSAALYLSWRLLAAKAIAIPLMLHAADHRPSGQPVALAPERQEVVLAKTSRLVFQHEPPGFRAALVDPSKLLVDRSIVGDRLRLALLRAGPDPEEDARPEIAALPTDSSTSAAAAFETEPEPDDPDISPVLQAAIEDIEPPIPVSRPDASEDVPAVIPIARPRIPDGAPDSSQENNSLAKLTVAPKPAVQPASATLDTASLADSEPKKKRTLFGLLGFAKAEDEDDNPTSPGSVTRRRDGVAVYDIEASTVYLPNGEKLEAHSGIGPMRDKPAFVDQPNKGPTPPHTYYLSLRESAFHGVEAIRLTPVEGETAIFGRNGLLAHTYMLGKEGDSNGCVVFKDYDRFLAAFKKGQVKQMVVVPRLREAPSSAFASLLSSRS